MYEYDTYVEARKDFPRLREPLHTEQGEWFWVKSDVLAGTMTFSSSKETMANVTSVPVERVREILSLNRQGKSVEQLHDAEQMPTHEEEPTYRTEEDSITRFDQAKRRKNKNRNKHKGNRPQGEGGAREAQPRSAQPAQPQEGGEQRPQHNHNRHNRNRGRRFHHNGSGNPSRGNGGEQ